MKPPKSILLKLSAPIMFGPGKAELLERIAELGSLQSAAAAMEMSYMKAWKLVKSLNESFREPLVLMTRGGKSQGGAKLTDNGREVLEMYQEALKVAEGAVAPILRKMSERLVV